MLDANKTLDQEREAGTLSERVLEMDVDQDDSNGPYIEMVRLSTTVALYSPC